MFPFICIFFISFFISLTTLPLINQFAVNKRLLDFEDKRKQSRNPIPRIGGLSIFLGIIGSLFYLLINKDLNLGLGNVGILLILSVGFFLIGFFDDLVNISPWPRLIIQIISCCIGMVRKYKN